MSNSWLLHSHCGDTTLDNQETELEGSKSWHRTSLKFICDRIKILVQMKEL